MPIRTALALATLLLFTPTWAAEKDPCSLVSSAPDVQLTVALKDGRSVFQEGEIIPLVLSFTSTAKNRYSAGVHTYDRSGRVHVEHYCVEPAAPDPLASYFNLGTIGGGMYTMQPLSTTAFITETELNEWRRLSPGHYRVYAISYRVSRRSDPGEPAPYGVVNEVIRSSPVELDVNPADPTWQAEQLRSATQTLEGSPSPNDARRAARRLRFLNSRASTQQLARFYWGLNSQGPVGFGSDLMFGLFGSPYRTLAIDSMHEQIAAPDHAITEDFLRTLVYLQVTADPGWDQSYADKPDLKAMRGLWERRRAHQLAVTKLEVERTLAVLSRKVGQVRALTLQGLLAECGADPAIVQAIRPALIAAWADLPLDSQREVIEHWWPLLAGPEMLPLLRRMVADPPPQRGRPAPTATARKDALKRIYELDPAAGRELILREARQSEIALDRDLIAILPRKDQVAAAQPAVERVGRSTGMYADYELLDYADDSALGAVRSLFEGRLGKWDCLPEAAMLRYFLRVDSQYGVKQLSAALSGWEHADCRRRLLTDLAGELPKVQPRAIQALDDPDFELAANAAGALARWGSADAEPALWARLQRFHQEWAGREDQLHFGPDHDSPGYRAAALESALVRAIAEGASWICPADKLARLAALVHTKEVRRQIEIEIGQWKQPAVVNAGWSPARPTFTVLQYSSLTEEQFLAKLAQLPKGTRLVWQFWPPGQISPLVTVAMQDALYERIRTIAEKNGLTLGKTNHP